MARVLVKQQQSVGEMKIMPVNSIPIGWLSCDGSAVSRTTYAALFALIGTTYGAGDGSTTFTLPAINSHGRFLRGTGGNAAAIGAGQADRTKKNGLTATAAASSVSGTTNIAHGHADTIATATDGGHTHPVRYDDNGSPGVTSAVMSGQNVDNTSPNFINGGAASGTHAHAITGAVTSLGTTNVALASGSAAAQAITVGAGDIETNPTNYAVVYCIRT